MNSSIKGVLWSALVFPGTGEIVLKYYWRGASLMLTVSVCMTLIGMRMVQQANDIFEKIKATGMAISTDDVANVVIEMMPDSAGAYRTLMFIIAGCWIVSIVDVILIGRKKDRARRKSAPDLTDSVELK